VFGPELFITPALPFHELTLLLESDGQDVRATLASTIAAFQDLTAEEINTFYANFIELIDPNSFTFDDSSTLPTARPDMSMATETMDNDMFTRYSSDSSY
jgi:hypothetical protein